MFLSMSRRRFHCWVIFACAGWVVVATAHAADDSVVEAHRLLQRGKYAEAVEAYEQLKADKPITASLGIARCLVSQGKVDEGLKVLNDALKPAPKDADLLAAVAQIHFDRGKYDLADRAIAAALKQDAEHLLARWLHAERLRVDGKLDDADVAYKLFVDYYNEHDVEQADDLRIVGLAAANFARWNKLSDQFSFLVNDLLPDALAADENYWQAHYEAGRLYLEKYNESEARKEFQAALKINPNAAEVYAAAAELALQKYDLDDARRAAELALDINPSLLAAHLAQADVHVANLSFADALKSLENALPLHPLSELTLGRLAGVYAILDGLPSSGPKDGDQTRFTKLLKQVSDRNSHCGEFFFALGSTFDLARRYPLAAHYYRESVERMPQLVAAHGSLGMTYMRLGEEVAAKQWLDESFDRDPFNARVSNSLKVLEVLESYAIVETEHFILKFDRGHDELLIRYAARYLEEDVYPQLCKQYDFQPQGKSLFEVFNRARNTGGHGWFSARMVGLPFVGTVGACAGKMVALASPNDMPKKYNWARVLKHEFVHVLNLQQTDFCIPHWYTEALAVESEGGVRPPSWETMLLERVPKGDTFNLDTINLGFVRPKSGEDWQMAYCQAQLYAQYMVATYGADALAKMLKAYGDHLTTREAIKRCFDVEQDEFEKGYSEHLKKLVAGFGGKAKKSSHDPAALMRSLAADPKNPDLMVEAAVLRLGAEDYAQARKLADAALKIKPDHRLANYVLARVRRVVGEDDEARKLFEVALDRDQPDARVIRALAEMCVEAAEHDRAAELYELAAKHDPHNIEWTKSLARIHIIAKNHDKLRGVLEKLAAADPDDLVIRKKLAQMALSSDDFKSARRWAMESLWIDVHDVAAHRMLIDAARGLGDHADVAFEYEALVRLDGKDLELRLALAEAYVASGKPDKAKEALKALLERSADHEAAKKLLEKLEKNKSTEGKAS